jgi:indole-3-glycerol phosphate synthase
MDDPQQVKLFREHGYSAFLIGEHFMKSADPGKALASFIQSIDS